MAYGWSKSSCNTQRPRFVLYDGSHGHLCGGTSHVHRLYVCDVCRCESCHCHSATQIRRSIRVIDIVVVQNIIASKDMHRSVNRSRTPSPRCLFDLDFYKHHRIGPYAPHRIEIHALVCKQDEMFVRSCLQKHHSIGPYAPHRIEIHVSVCKPVESLQKS